jgi:nucleoside-diphosphate-sugar epimerase
MTAVIAGCGALGTQVGLLLATAGHRVIGIRRSTELLPDGIDGLGVDLRRERPPLPDDVDVLIFALTADERTAADYRSTYLDGLHNVIDALPHAAASAARVLFVSSTSVYGDAHGDWVDETTPPQPVTATAEVLLEAEQMLGSRLPQAVVLRLAGIYGPDRGRLVDRVRAGTPTSSPWTYTNRIHIDDASAAAVHLLTRVPRPDALYIGADNEPVDSRELVRFLADELDVERPPVSDDSTVGGGKRCRNGRLLATGFTLRFPTYREGYRSVLAAQRERR